MTELKHFLECDCGAAMWKPPPNSPIVALVSGGKDSTALSLWLTEQKIEHRRVHFCTHWEAPETDEYLREYLPTVIGQIEFIEPDCGGMEKLIEWKGMFPARNKRFCTEFLKIVPIMKWLSDQYPHDVVINAVGIRAAESVARAYLEEMEDVSWAVTWRPLLRWSEQNVIDLHRRHSIRPNPLYLFGASRVGCWPCIFARKAEIAMVCRRSPDRIDLIEKLETDLFCAMKKRADERGEVLRWKPTFFFRNEQYQEEGEPRGTPIRDVERWALGGGEQLDLFGSDDVGCMRWGLCGI